MVPIDRIRLHIPQPSQVTDRGSNAQGTGLWSRMDDGHEARLINHTAKCSGPPLLVYRHPRPQAERASWPLMPSGWLEAGADSMKLVLALGTLRPAAAMNQGNRVRTASSGPASSTAGWDASAARSFPALQAEASKKRHAVDQ